MGDSLSCRDNLLPGLNVSEVTSVCTLVASGRKQIFLIV